MAFIDAQRKLGHKVYIHCKVGGWQMCVRAKIGLEKLVLHYWCTKKLFNDKKDDACSPTKKSTEGILAELRLCFVRQVTAEPVPGARFWGLLPCIRWSFLPRGVQLFHLGWYFKAPASYNMYNPC